MTKKFYPESKVEVSGLEAKYYDQLMNIITFDQYSKMLKNVFSYMDINPEDKILDLGAGTGRNACFMANRLNEKGELIGLDISDIMINQFKQKCQQYNNVKIIQQRIDIETQFHNYFNKAFISFVLHGFPHNIREKIIANIYNALKPKGQLFILDYNEFILEQQPFYIKTIFKIIECPYAFDFIQKDWKQILQSFKFNNFNQISFFKKYIRLLKAEKI